MQKVATESCYAAHIGVCEDTKLDIVIFDTSDMGTGPRTVVTKGTALVATTNTTVWGIVEVQLKYETTSENGLDTDRMTVEACINASTHSVCHPAP